MNALKKKKLKSSTGFLPKQYILNVSRMPIQPRTPLPRALFLQWQDRRGTLLNPIRLEMLWRLQSATIWLLQRFIWIDINIRYMHLMQVLNTRKKKEYS